MYGSHQSTEVITTIKEKSEELVPKLTPRKYEIVYRNLLTFGYWHLAGIYGVYLCFTEAKWATIMLSFVMFVVGEIGVTAGAHRLWAHKTYKAKLPLQILLMIMNSIAFQNTVTEWVRDHRLHHKYSDTDADPHNASRGFFYSHVGWLLVRKHPEVKTRGKTIDMSDIYNNPVLRFQKRYAIPLIGMICFGLPTVMPVYCWGESWRVGWNLTMLRYVLNLNVTFLVNSAAHLWGNKPYDVNILPAQNPAVSFLAFGEGFHNYHHAFPWDYRTAELGNNYLNATTKFIDFFAAIGWAYDLKTVSEDIIRQRSGRTGDGTNIWGWGDKKLVAASSGTSAIEIKIPLPWQNNGYAMRRNALLHHVPLSNRFGTKIELGDLPHHVLIFRLANPASELYRAFCAGSIIGDMRVISSANCFLTNRKSHRYDYGTIRVCAGVIETVVIRPDDDDIQQWRLIRDVRSQRFFRFPAYNLAILIMHKPWKFNAYVNKIPYESSVHDFDGVCTSTAVKATKSWSMNKYVYTEQVEMIQRKQCEEILQRSTKNYFCTEFDKRNKYAYAETEGGGLVCYETGDPKEVDPKQGILVGVTSIVNLGLPNLHMRIGNYYQWVKDHGCRQYCDCFLIVWCVFFIIDVVL